MGKQRGCSRLLLKEAYLAPDPLATYRTAHVTIIFVLLSDGLICAVANPAAMFSFVNILVTHQR